MFTLHEARSEVLGELHARPFELIETPQRIYHFGFLTNEQEAAKDRQALEALCQNYAAPPPAKNAKYYKLDLPQWTLRWEQHSEFTTYTWMTQRGTDVPFFNEDLKEITSNALLKQPGDLIVATQFMLTKQKLSQADISNIFSPTSLCMFETQEKDALVIGDFCPDNHGLTRFIIEDRALGATSAGVLTQRLLEVETYRTLALLGLGAVKQSSPLVQEVEVELAKLTHEISKENDIETERGLLKKLTHLAARLEAMSAKTSGRFSASDAYYNIVQSRLSAIKEIEIPGNRRTFSAFFSRRLLPAIRTCTSTNERQTQLSGKLMRTAELLRTRIQFELEEQNRNLLASMNRRARLQLRLQQTVEGLSVAAISYYMVGLISYMVKGLKIFDIAVPEALVTAISVPVVILLVWFIIHSIRQKFEHEEKDT